MRTPYFDLRRLHSAEDVYLFHGTARDNPADRRLFALTEVRDLVPARDAAGAGLDWIGGVPRRLIEFTQAGGTVNVVVTGGILVITPASATVLTRQARAARWTASSPAMSCGRTWST